NLEGAYLEGAYLEGANLEGANLAGAYLEGAYLEGAYLAGAKVNGLKLVGRRPFFQVGPIGSRNDMLRAYTTEEGVYVQAGCFWGTIEEFAAKLADTHGDNHHAVEYTCALALIDTHAATWPAEVSS